MINSILNYLENMCYLMSTIDVDLVNLIKNELFYASKERNAIYIMGNGISSATSEHFANDLAKKASEYLVNNLGFRVNAITLTEPMPFLTAVANDMSLEEIFVESLKLNSKENDILFVSSLSKPHTNIIKAFNMQEKKD